MSLISEEISIYKVPAAPATAHLPVYWRKAAQKHSQPASFLPMGFIAGFFGLPTSVKFSICHANPLRFNLRRMLRETARTTMTNGLNRLTGTFDLQSCLK